MQFAIIAILILNLLSMLGVVQLIKIIKNGQVYAPDYLGKRDILIFGNRIGLITEEFDYKLPGIMELEVIDAGGKYVFPGFIDGHVHIMGGGGEGGFKTRTPEIFLSDAIKGGITSIIGCLGTDGVTRTMEALYAKAKGLEEEGISTYLMTGSYRVPIETITGSPMKDMILIDKIIGAGEIALSDHRSSVPEISEMKKIATDVRVGGLLTGKGGVIVLHIGDGKAGLSILRELVETTDIPYSQFLPTHINRVEHLFKEGVEYAKSGGNIDFTTSSGVVNAEDDQIKASICLKRCLDAGVPIERITFTSDGQGSLPIFNERRECIKLGIGSVTSLFIEVKDAIKNEKIDIDKAIRVITKNPAEIFKIKGKGAIEKGYDADLVIVDENTLEIDTVVAMGRIMMKNKNILVQGTYE